MKNTIISILILSVIVSTIPFGTLNAKDSTDDTVFLAVIVNILLPGAGHFVIGDTKGGCIAMSVYYLVFPLFLIVIFMTSSWELSLACSIVLPIFQVVFLVYDTKYIMGKAHEMEEEQQAEKNYQF